MDHVRENEGQWIELSGGERWKCSVSKKLGTAIRLLRRPRLFIEVVEEKIGIGPLRRELNQDFYRPIRERITRKYRRRFGVGPDLKNPTRYTEKAQWRKVFCPQIGEFGRLADKAVVYDYVAERISPEHLVPILWCGDDISEDLIRSFGDNVVLKPTHRSGQVVFIEEQDSVRHDVIVEKLRTMLRWPYSMVGEEPWYGRVKPQVMVQPMLRSRGAGQRLNDAKFHVFAQPDGSQVVLGQIIDRDTNSHAMFDEEFNSLGFQWNVAHFNPPPRAFAVPTGYREMVADAKRLACGIDYVRVDFMVAEDNYYFTELTFSPAGGRPLMNPPEFDVTVGGYWHLDTGNPLKRSLWFARTWMPLWKTERPMRILRRLARRQNEWRIPGIRIDEYRMDEAPLLSSPVLEE
jgi:hypothetical protein